MITQSELKQILHYDPATGVLTHKTNTGKAKAGYPAGYVNSRGYTQVGIANKIYYAHRIAFLYQTGEWPPAEIDHINGVKTDNRWCNLRSVAHSENMKNMARPTNNSSGVIGVYWQPKRRRWLASIGTKDGVKHLGVFDNFDNAVAARKAAEEKHGFHRNHGRSPDTCLDGV